MTTPAAWLAVQNGEGPFASDRIDRQTRFIRDGRDWATFVHTDPSAGLLVSFYNAGIMLFELGAPLNLGNPYLGYAKQAPFATFGVPHFLGLLGEAKQRACKDVWYAKWFVHRTLPPGGLWRLGADDDDRASELSAQSRCAEFAGIGGYILEIRDLPVAAGFSRRLAATSLLRPGACFDGGRLRDDLEGGVRRQHPV